jgi:arsenate reductase
MALDRKKVLFLCFHNSARSQIAEGLIRGLYDDKYEVYSAGVEATQVDPRAVKVMKEIGIDISGQQSKRIDGYRGILFDVAVTVCDEAKEICPVCRVGIKALTTTPAAKKIIHKTFKDPTIPEGSEEDPLAVFRQVRDDLKKWITHTFGI